MACRLQNETTHCEFLYKTRVTPAVSIPHRYSFTERIGKLWWVLRISSVFTFLDVKTDLHFPFCNCATSSQGPTAPNGIPYVRDWRRTINHGSVWLSREEHLQFILPLFSFPKGLALLFFAKEFFYLHKEWKCEHRESNGVDKWSFSFQYWPIFVLQVYGINRDRNYTIKKVDGNRNNYVKKNKLESGRQILFAFCYIWNLHLYLTSK